MKFHENPSRGSRVVPCRQIDRLTDMAKLIVAYRNLGARLKNCSYCTENFSLTVRNLVPRGLCIHYLTYCVYQRLEYRVQGKRNMPHVV